MIFKSLFLFLMASPCFAGLFEVGISGSYRKTNFDIQTVTEMETGTASLGYYFWELSALELSYTQGDALQTTANYSAYQVFKAAGVDLMVTLATKDSAFKPYIKLGASYVFKDLRVYYSPGLISNNSAHSEGFTPTAGLGFKLMIGPQFGIKIGVDASTSPIQTASSSSNPAAPTTIDFAGTGGISYIF